jgi:peptide/nickel transport system permease protein
LASVGLAHNLRIIRANMIEALESDHVEAARLNGLPERLVLFRYALPTAIVPALPGLVRWVAYLAGGTIVVEILFGYNGIGPAYVEAIHKRDVPVAQAVGLIIAAFTIGANLIADILGMIFVPRMRTSSSSLG